MCFTTMSTFCWMFCYVTSYLLLLTVSLSGLTIKQNQMSPLILCNGTDQPVVLDCDYGYDSSEIRGLTVKWFWYRDHEPVYQWIPGEVPEVRGILKGRVNVSYYASTDKYSAHRALQILRPTSELSGTYTCTVSTFYNEKKHSVRLLVYATVKSLDLTFRKVTPTTVNVTCSAHGLYPRPRMTIYARTQRDKFEIKSVNVNTVRHPRHNNGNTEPWEEPVLWEAWGESVNKKKPNQGHTRTRRYNDLKQPGKEFDIRYSHELQDAKVISETENPLDYFHEEKDESVGSYSIYADVILADETLHEEGQLLECEVMLPGTPYVERTNVVYFPGYDAMELYAQESTSGQGIASSANLIFSIMSMMFLML